MRTPSWRSCRMYTVAASGAHLDLGQSLGHFTVTGRQASWPSSVQAPGWGCEVLSLPSKTCSACYSECRARRGADAHTLPTSSRPCKDKGTPPGRWKCPQGDPRPHAVRRCTNEMHLGAIVSSSREGLEHGGCLRPGSPGSMPGPPQGRLAAGTPRGSHRDGSFTY